MFVADVAADIGDTTDHDWRFWRAAFGDNKRPELYQVLTPYRGEEFGTESLNAAFQELVQGRPPGEMRIIDRSGIALNDKVIQIKNRPPSNPILAWVWSTRRNKQVEVYNGELGFANPHSFDAKKTSWAGFRPVRCQVSFSSKPDYAVGYGRDLGKRPDGRWIRREDIDENLELAYAVSIHKAQGSEFDRVYFVVPKHKQTLLSRELFYTGLTRAARHCTLLIEEDISPLLSMRRLERSRLLRINASLFSFRPVPDDLRVLGGWYEEGKIHSTLTEYMVRSKSEVIIANLLFDREIPFQYEAPLFAPDGTFYLPDFTISWHGQDWYWEHLGRLDDADYRNHWETKCAWYDAHFPGRLVTTVDSGDLTKDAAEVINSHFTA
jgi:exodeoxyribonuclease V alpha subunit